MSDIKGSAKDRFKNRKKKTTPVVEEKPVAKVETKQTDWEEEETLDIKKTAFKIDTANDVEDKKDANEVADWDKIGETDFIKVEVPKPKPVVENKPAASIASKTADGISFGSRPQFGGGPPKFGGASGGGMTKFKAAAKMDKEYFPELGDEVKPQPASNKPKANGAPKFSGPNRFEGLNQLAAREKSDSNKYESKPRFDRNNDNDDEEKPRFGRNYDDKPRYEKNNDREEDNSGFERNFGEKPKYERDNDRDNDEKPRRFDRNNDDRPRDYDRKPREDRDNEEDNESFGNFRSANKHIGTKDSELTNFDAPSTSSESGPPKFNFTNNKKGVMTMAKAQEEALKRKEESDKIEAENPKPALKVEDNPKPRTEKKDGGFKRSDFNSDKPKFEKSEKTEKPKQEKFKPKKVKGAFEVKPGADLDDDWGRSKLEDKL
jgi:hypothetical protein